MIARCYLALPHRHQYLPAFPTRRSSDLVIARKTTAKDVVNSVAETDLLNGEITVAGGQIGATGKLILTAYGDCLNNVATEKDRKSTRLNSIHMSISYSAFCLKKKKHDHN